MQKIKKFTIFVFTLAILVAPVFSSFAQTIDKDIPDKDTGLVPCGHATNGVITNPCSFGDLMTLINEGIKFILFKLAIPIAAIMFAYAGFLMVPSGGSTEARGRAKKIFSNAVYGIVFAAGAWLIIRTILQILGYKGDWIGL